jgi:hypothetical protein
MGGDPTATASWALSRARVSVRSCRGHRRASSLWSERRCPLRRRMPRTSARRAVANARPLCAGGDSPYFLRAPETCVWSCCPSTHETIHAHVLFVAHVTCTPHSACTAPLVLVVAPHNAGCDVGLQSLPPVRSSERRASRAAGGPVRWTREQPCRAGADCIPTVAVTVSVFGRCVSSLLCLRRCVVDGATQSPVRTAARCSHGVVETSASSAMAWRRTARRRRS